MSARHLTAL